MSSARRLALVLACALAAPAGAHEGHEGGGDVVALPPLAGARYEPPAPGTYELPAIGRVGPHTLIDVDGAPATLPEVAPGSAALVSFVYLSCPAACPATHAVFQRIDRSAAEDDSLTGRLRLYTVSFDPARDTPERMGRLRSQLAPHGDWRFLTAASASDVAPVLTDFGQDAQASAAATEEGSIQHVLKVFLVDDELRVRNVYSAEFLVPELLLNDVRTVLAGEAAARR